MKMVLIPLYYKIDIKLKTNSPPPWFEVGSHYASWLYKPDKEYNKVSRQLHLPLNSACKRFVQIIPFGIVIVTR